MDHRIQHEQTIEEEGEEASSAWGHVSFWQAYSVHVWTEWNIQGLISAKVSSESFQAPFREKYMEKRCFFMFQLWLLNANEILVDSKRLCDADIGNHYIRSVWYYMYLYRC